MSSTKIINVARNDNFEDVFDLVRSADATDLILIFPKSGSKFSKQESYLAILKKESDRLGKGLSVMTEDKAIVGFASSLGLSVLGENAKRTSPKPITKKSKAEISYSDIQELTSEYDRESVADLNTSSVQTIESDSSYDRLIPEPQISLASSRNSSRKTMADILPEKTEKSIKIKSDNSKSIDIDINKTAEDFFSRDSESSEEVDEIWSKHKPSPRASRSDDKGSRQFGFKNGSSFKKYVYIGLPILLAGFVVAYFTLGSAELDIEVRKDTVDLTLNVVLSTQTALADKENNKIPGQKFTISEEVSDMFPATTQKNVAQKSKGRIRIFNNNLNQPQRLVATTRFETPDGKIFRIPQTILVPGAIKLSSGKIEPGTLESDAVADRPGPEYNIEPSSFKVPGLKGLPQYDQISAISTTAMSGGSIGQAKVISEEDFNKAKISLESKLRKKIEDAIQKRVSDFKIIEGSANIKIDQPISNTTPDQASDSLEMKLRGTADVIAFRESDLNALIDFSLDKRFDLTLNHSSIDKKFSNFSYNSSSDQLSTTLSITGLAAARIDEGKILEDILGLSMVNLDTYFTQNKDIKSVRVATSPFWVKSIPKDKSKVRLTVQ